MASALEKLQSQLARNPSDEDLLRRFGAECLAHGDYAALRQGLAPLITAPGDPRRVQPLATVLAGLLEAHAITQGAPRDAAALHLRAARLYGDVAERPTAAAEALVAAWQAQPDPRVTAHAAALLGAPPIGQLPPFMLQAMRQVGDTAARTRAVRRLAALHLADHQVDAAEALFNELQTLAPGDADAAAGLATIGELRASTESEIDEARARVERVGSGDDAVRAWTHLGDVELAAGNTVEAEQAFRSAVDAGPAADAEASLEALLREQRRLDDLATLLSGWLDGATRERQVLLRRRLYRLLHDELGRPDEARTYLVTGAPDPPPPDAAAVLAEVATLGDAGDWPDAAQRLETAARHAKQKDVKAALLGELARIYEHELADLHNAERAYRRLRVTDPRSTLALGFYRRWFAERDEPRRAYANLAQLREVLGDDEDTAERQAIAIEMAQLAESGLESPDKAIDAWRGVRQAAPDHARAAQELERLYRAHGRWHALVDHLEQRLASLPDDAIDERVQTLFDILGVYQDPHGLPMDEMVVRTYRRIVDMAPTNVVALDGLAGSLEEREKWQELVTVLRQKIEVLDDPAELLSVFHQIASLYLDRIRSENQAIAVLEQILELDAKDLLVVRKLRALYQRRSDAARLYETYQRELELLDGAEQLEVIIELATLAADPLFRHEEAIGWWRQVLELEPRHERATSALQELHAERKDWDGYIDLLDAKLADAKTRKQRVEILLELGEIVYSRLGDEDRARTIFTQIAELSPFNTTARGFLQRLYVTRRAWDELAALYAPRDDWRGYIALLRDYAEHVEDRYLRADVHLEIARTTEAHLKDDAATLRHLEQALAAVDDRVDVARMLVKRFKRGVSGKRRLPALLALARHSDDLDEQLDAWQKAAKIHTKAGDEAAALEAWAHALRLGAAVGDVAALQPLTKAAEVCSAFEAARDALLEALVHLPAEATGARVDVHRELGHLARTRLSDNAAAVSHYRWVLQLAPGDGTALDALEEIALSQNDFEGLEVVFKARADAAERPADSIPPLRRLGELYEDVLADGDRAAVAYQEILTVDPTDAEALEALIRVHDAGDAHSELVTALEALLTRLADGDPRDRLRLKIADVQIAPLGQPAAAVDHLRDVLERGEATAVDAAKRVIALFEENAELADVAPLAETIFREREDGEGLVRALAARLETTDDLGVRVALLDEIAMLSDSVLGEPEVAFNALLERFSLAPDDQDTWRELVRLAESTDAWESLAATWRERVDLGPSLSLPPTELSELRIVLADVYHRQLIELEDAIALLELVVAESEVPAQTKRALEDLEVLYKKSADLDNYVRVKLLSSEQVHTRAEKREKIFEAVRSLAGALKRPAEAIALCQRLLKEDPADAEVADVLTGLLEDAGEHDALETLYETRLGVATTQQQSDELELRRALYRRDGRGQWDAATDALVELVASPSVGPETRDTLLEMARAESCSTVQRTRILDVLEAHFVAQSEPHGRLAVLIARADFTAPGPPRAGVLRQAAAICLADPAAAAADPDGAQNAFDFYAQALMEHPADEAALAALIAIATALTLWEPLVEALSLCAEQAQEALVAGHLRTCEASVLETHLDDPERAIAAWRRQLALHDSGAEIALAETHDELDRLYRKTDNRRALLDILDRKRRATADPAETVTLLMARAEVLHALERPRDAIEALREALAITRSQKGDPLVAERALVVTHLESLLALVGEHGQVVDLLLDSSLETQDDERRRQLTYRAAEVALERLDAPKRAIVIYEGHLEHEADDEVSLEQLVGLYERVERWEDQVRMLDAQRELAARADAVPEQVALRVRQGEVLLQRLKDSDRAVTAWAGALALEPSHEPALEALEAVASGDDDVAMRARTVLAEAYRQNGQAPALARTLEAMVTATEAGPRATLAAELAEVYRDQLDDAAAAWVHASDAYGLTPTGLRADERRVLAIERGLAAKKQAALQELLLGVAAGLPDATERLERRLADLATLAAHKHPEDGLLPFRRALLADDPTHVATLDAFEDWARKRNDVGALIDALVMRVDITEDAAARIVIRSELGRLLGQDEARRDEAVAVYRAILEAQPVDKEAFGSLAKLLADLGRHPALAELVSARLERVAETPEANTLRKQLAALNHGPLSDPGQAVTMYARVLTEDPDDADAVAGLEALWGEGRERDRIFTILEPYYERTGDWDKLVALYTSTLERDADAELQAQCLAKMAHLELVQLDRPEAAYATMKALVERLDDPSAHLARLDELAERLDRWDDLVVFYEQRVASGRADASLMARLAAIMETRTKSTDRAIHFYRFSFDKNPHDAQVRDSLSKLLREEGRWAELVKHALNAAKHSRDDGDRKTLLLAASEVLAGELDDGASAVDVLGRVLALEPAHPVANERVAVLLETLEQWAPLHAHYRAWLEAVATDGQAVALQVRLARSLVRFPETVHEGLGELGSVLGADPKQSAGIDALREMLVRAEDSEAAGDALPEAMQVANANAAAMLESAFGAGVTPEWRARILHARLRVQPPGEARQASLTELARLLSELGPAETAFARFAEALESDVGNIELEQLTEGLVAEHGLWEALNTLYQTCAQSDSPEAPVARYLFKVGNILHDHLDRRDEAIVWYEKLLAAQPGNVDALELLTRYYKGADDAANECRVLAGWLQHGSPDDAEADALRRRLGVLRMDALDDADGAIDAFEGCLPGGAADKGVQQPLERLYAKTGKFDALVAMYEMALERTEAPDLQLGLLAKQSQVYETRLANVDAARDAARRMLAIEPAHAFALVTLDRVERKREDWPAVDEILSLRVGAAESEAARAKLLIERSVVALEHLSNPSDALSYCAEADTLIGAGSGPDALVAGFEALLRSDAVRREAAAHLRPRYRARKTWPRLLNALMIEHTATDDPQARVALAVEAAELAEKRLEDLGVALRISLTGLKANPEAMALRRLVNDFAARHGDWGSVTQVGDQILTEMDDGELVRDIGVWLGAIHREHRDDVPAAIATFERVLGVDPTNTAANTALQALYPAAEDWAGLKHLLERQLPHATDTERLRIRTEIATLVATHAGRVDAVPLLASILDTDPAYADAQALLVGMLADDDAGAAAAKVLEPVYRATESWRDLVSMFTTRADAVEAPADKAALWMNAGTVYEVSLEDRIAALKLYSRAVYAVPGDRDALRQLERLGFEIGAWEQLVKVLGDVQPQITDPEGQRDVLLHLAQIYETRLEAPTQAAEALERVLSLDPDHKGALVGLRRIYRETTDVDAFGTYTEQLARLETRAERQKRLWDELFDAAATADAQDWMVKSCEEALALNDADNQAATRLVPLYRAMGKHRDVAILLGGLADRATTPTETAALRMELGDVRERWLRDASGAVEAYEEAFELDPTLDEAASRIESYYREEGQWDALAAFLEGRLGKIDDAEKRLSVRLKLAEILEREVKDIDGAVATYLDALEEAPGNAAALDALIRMYAQNRRFDELARAFERKAQAVERPDERVGALIRAAAVYLDQLGDDLSAARLLDDVREASPGNTEERLLRARLHTVRDEPELAAEILDGLVNAVSGPRKARILLELARIWSETLEHPEKALPYALEARKLTPNDAGLAEMLPGLLEQTGSWSELVALLEADYGAAATAEERAACALALARLHQTQLPDEQAMSTWLARAEEAAPDDADVASAYVEHYAAKEQWDEAAPRLEKLVAYLADKKLLDELPPRAHQLGKIYEQLSEDERAESYYRMAMEADGTYIPNLIDYGRLLVRQKSWHHALKVHQNLLMQSRKIEDKDARNDVLFHLALASYELGQKTRAKQYLSRLEKQAKGHAGAKALRKRMGA